MSFTLTRFGRQLAWLACLSLLCGASTSRGTDWNVSVIDGLLAQAQPGQPTVRVGDMQILVRNLRAWRNELAGQPGPELAFDGVAPHWPGGVVPYTYETNVTAPHQQAFLDGALEWATFANLTFIARTTQANYVTVVENTGLNGGESTVGMIGGQQFLQIGPQAWNRPTICHELGHALGLVHEHQRSNRDAYVVVLTNNILPGTEGNFVLLPNSNNQSPYDFLSIMHYNRNSFSTDPPNLDTLEPLPAYSQFLNLMGQQYDPVLSASDRAGMAAIYGAGPTQSPLVSNTRDSGPGSLRAALYYAFDHPGTTVTFNVPTSDPGFSNNVFTIQPTDVLPGLWHATTLDGGTEPTNSNPSGPEIVINGALAPPPSVYPNGLNLRGTNCLVRSLVVNGFIGTGIVLNGTNCAGNVVSGCYLGIDSTGQFSVPNGSIPLLISGGAHNNTIGGITAAARNILSGSTHQGMVITDPGTTNNVVEGNYIGLNATGTGPLPNAWAGLEAFGGPQNNLIGGSAPGAGNVISGNNKQGVALDGLGTMGNVVRGNYIGLNPAGLAAISNTWAGIEIFGNAQSNVIFGNVLSGNGYQGFVVNQPGTDGQIVQGNYIGLSADGTLRIPNGGAGVGIFNQSCSNLIGGRLASQRNIISGNNEQGVAIANTDTSWNVVEGNFIGLNPAGTAALSNTWAGVQIFDGAQANYIGGTGPGAANVVSGNGIQGVAISDPGTSGNWIQGNLIGTDPTGLNAIPNGYSAVDIWNGASGNLIGGAIGARNILSGNLGYGVSMSGSGTDANVVQGNTLGLDILGSNPVPNGYGGVGMWSGAAGNQIGGVTPGAGNVIANNSSDGVQVYDPISTNNTIRGNSIFGNNGQGIALYSGGDSAEPAPLLTSAVLGLGTQVAGHLTNQPTTTYHLDFYASPPPLASAQARVYRGARDVTTDVSGGAVFSLALAQPVLAGQILTATATDPAGNTSSISTGLAVTTVDHVGDGIPDAWRSAHFGGSGTTTNSQSCATCDPDHDGLSNWQEFLTGTDPTNTASSLRIIGLVNNGSDAVLSFPSEAGVVYRVEVRNEVTADPWELLTDNLIGPGGVFQVTEQGAGAYPKRFYRIAVP